VTHPIYLAAHARKNTKHGQAISAASNAALGGAGSAHNGQHATHVYVVARVGDIFLRLDGDVPFAKFGPWHPRFGVYADGPLSALLWRVYDTDGACFEQMLTLADNPPPYDPLEIGQATLTALRELINNIPFPWGRVALPRVPKLRSDVADACVRAMICTRLAGKVLGITPPTLYPESLCRVASTAFGPSMGVAEVLRGA